MYSEKIWFKLVAKSDPSLLPTIGDCKISQYPVKRTEQSYIKFKADTAKGYPQYFKSKSGTVVVVSNRDNIPQGFRVEKYVPAEANLAWEEEAAIATAIRVGQKFGIEGLEEKRPDLVYYLPQDIKEDLESKRPTNEADLDAELGL